MGFWKDVADLRAATKANVKAGRGSRSMIEAVEQLKQAPKVQPIKRDRHLKRTFVLSALFGAIWQSTRRRR